MTTDTMRRSRLVAVSFSPSDKLAQANHWRQFVSNTLLASSGDPAVPLRRIPSGPRSKLFMDQSHCVSGLIAVFRLETRPTSNAACLTKNSSVNLGWVAG